MAQGPQKSKGVAVLLTIFFGVFGADDFYIGNQALGFVRLGIFIFASVVGGFGSIITFFLTFIFIFLPLIFVLSFWSAVNAFRYAFMSNERFQQMVARNYGR